MSIQRAAKFAVLFLSVLPMATVSANAQCRTAPMPVDIVIHHAEAIDNPDNWTMGDPELYIEVAVNGTTECVLGNNGAESMKLQGPLKCTVMVAPPFDPIQVTVRLKEDDSAFGGGDDQMDIGGDPGDLTLDLEYDPGCLRVRGLTPDDVPGCFG